jgi:predicted Zn-ribbon and HTH transcriptional regulator
LKPDHEVADIINIHHDAFVDKYKPAVQVLKTLKAIKSCRTAVLGGHKSRCRCCGYNKISYNSCRNRHCPKCQATNRERWILGRESELLPVPYYHIVFTLPHHLNPLALRYPKQVYHALFRAAWLTIRQFAADPKYLSAKTGMTAILHTWGQQLSLHPHLHCIVPAGGITSNGKWKFVQQKAKPSSRKGRYLYPRGALSQVFRAIFMKELRKHITIPQAVARKLFENKWVVDAQQPFKTPESVIEYLGRYTHKIAISNHRLIDVNDQTVKFRYKNYRTGKLSETMELGGVEFLRRFAQHILPHGFIRIRHYGILASRNKSVDLNQAKTDLGQEPWFKQTYSWDYIAINKLNIIPDQCPNCKEGVLEIIEIYQPDRGPPFHQLILT